MKKLSILVLSTLLIIVSGCTNFGNKKPPKNIIIDNIEYVTGFYDNLHVVGIEYKDFSSSLFIKDNYHWWKLEDSDTDFDIYYSRHKDSLNWFPTLYCRKDKFEDAKKYYTDPNNFEYYIGVFLQSETIVKLDESQNKQLVEKAVLLATNKVKLSTNDYSKKVLQLDNKLFINPTIFRVSKDGLLSTTRSQWIYFENNLYYLDYADNSGFYLFTLNDEINLYLKEILIKYGIVS